MLCQELRRWNYPELTLMLRWASFFHKSFIMIASSRLLLIKYIWSPSMKVHASTGNNNAPRVLKNKYCSGQGVMLGNIIETTGD